MIALSPRGPCSAQDTLTRSYKTPPTPQQAPPKPILPQPEAFKGKKEATHEHVMQYHAVSQKQAPISKTCGEDMGEGVPHRVTG